MDRLKPIFVIGGVMMVGGLVTVTPSVICTGLIIMALVVCTVEIIEAVRGE